MLAGSGVELQRLYSDELVVETEPWLQSAQTAVHDADEIRRQLEDDIRRDLSGAQPFLHNGKVMFHQRTLTLVGRKLR